MDIKVYRCQICGEVYIGKERPKTCPFCGAHEVYFVLAKEWKLLKGEALSNITKDNLRKAMELEIDNTNFYKAVSEKSKGVYVSSMFKGLSKIEREHASTICKHLGIQKPDSDIGSDKAVDSDGANIEEANRREKRAVKFYREAKNQVLEQEIKEFFKALIEIESDHIVLTEQNW
jgi:rubrerythrin/rubredoxin